MQPPVEVFINGRFLTQPITGVQRSARMLLSSLDALLETGEIDRSLFHYTCLVPPACQENPGWRQIELRRVGRLNGNLWEQIDLAAAARGRLLFSPCNTGPFLHLNQVTVIHDASVFAAPEAYTFSFRLKYQFLIRWLAHFGRLVITDSEFSQREIARWCRLDPQRIVVNKLGCDHILGVEPDSSALARFNLEGKRYLLAVGSQSRHKNLALLADAARLLGPQDYEIIVAGGTFQRVFQGQELPLPPGMRQIGYVTDSELRALYQAALGFIFPSYYEGFGFPPLEAMACGCPVIISRAASLPEVGGDAALYCDPFDPRSLADQVRALLQMPRPQISTRAREQAARFLWKDTALRFSQILQNLHKPAEKTQTHHR